MRRSAEWMFTLASLLAVLGVASSVQAGPLDMYAWTGEGVAGDYLDLNNWRYASTNAHPPDTAALLNSRDSLCGASIDIGDGVAVNRLGGGWSMSPSGGTMIDVHGTGSFSTNSINSNGDGWVWSGSSFAHVALANTAARTTIKVRDGGTVAISGGWIGGTRYANPGATPYPVGNAGLHVIDRATVSVGGTYHIGSESTASSGMGGGFLTLEGYDAATTITTGDLRFATGNTGASVGGTNGSYPYSSGPADLDVILTGKNAGGHFNTVNVTGSLWVESLGLHAASEVPQFNLSTAGYTPVAGDLFSIVTAASLVIDGTGGNGAFNVGWGADFTVGAATYQLFNDNPDLAGDQPGIYLKVISGGAPSFHAGDANGDGSVDLQDFGLLKENFGIAIGGGAAWGQGDFNADGGIDLQDFGILKDHFGHTAGDTPIAAVPEPATMSLLVLGALAMIRRNRK